MNAQRTSAIIIVSGLASMVVWWRWPTAPAPNRIPLAHIQPPSAPEEAEGPPVMPPLPEPVEPPPAPVAVAEEPPPAPAPAFDPQAELSTAVPDYIRLLQSGDYIKLIQTYLPPDPDITDAERLAMGQMMQTMMQTPQAQQRTQKELTDLQFIQNSPPVISDNGDRATYTLPAGSAEQIVVFVKVNGRWYHD